MSKSKESGVNRRELLGTGFTAATVAGTAELDQRRHGRSRRFWGTGTGR